MNKLLEQVVTFAQACEMLGQSSTYMNDLVKANKIIEGEQYIKCGRIGLTTKNEVEKIRLRSKKNMSKSRDFNLMAKESVLIKNVRDLVSKLYEIADIAESKGANMSTYGAVMDIAGQHTVKGAWTYGYMLDSMDKYCSTKLHLKELPTTELRKDLEDTEMLGMCYMADTGKPVLEGGKEGPSLKEEEQVLSDAFQYFLLTLGR